MKVFPSQALYSIVQVHTAHRSVSCVSITTVKLGLHDGELKLTLRDFPILLCYIINSIHMRMTQRGRFALRTELFRSPSWHRLWGQKPADLASLSVLSLPIHVIRLVGSCVQV